MHKRKYLLDEKNKTFTKYYLNPDDQPKIVDEFEKGLKLNKIINYPKPISYDKNSIQYEGLEIKYSLYDLLKKTSWLLEISKNRAIFEKNARL